MNKIYEHKNGAYVSLEYGNLNIVKLYDSKGNLFDKIKCDTKQAANQYFAAFKKITKNI